MLPTFPDYKRAILAKEEKVWSGQTGDSDGSVGTLGPVKDSKSRRAGPPTSRIRDAPVMNSKRNRLPWWAGIAWSVQRLATGWTVRRSNPRGSEIFRTRADRTWGALSLLDNGYRVFPPGVKRPGRGVGYPVHLVPRLKEECVYTSTSPLGLCGLF
jgi:hypothetical protein